MLKTPAAQGLAQAAALAAARARAPPALQAQARALPGEPDQASQ